MQQFSLIIPFLACGSKNNPILGLHFIKAATKKKKNTSFNAATCPCLPTPMTKMGGQEYPAAFCNRSSREVPRIGTQIFFIK
jgi:hypothetical protein